MRAAIWAEAVKLANSLAPRVATIGLVLGVVALSGVILAAIASGNADIVAKLGRSASADWSGLLLSAAQITAAGGLGGFGIVIAWLFGREFTEGTITGLFALPVGRAEIALAKLIVYLVWSGVVAVLLAAALLVVGLSFGLGPPDDETLGGLARHVTLTILTAVLALPIAWASTLLRSVLGGVGITVGLIVLGQFSVLAGAGGWMTLAAPALWAMSGGTGVSAIQLGMLVPYAGISIGLTATAWHQLQLDR